ncbi:hypothetical protein [Parachitinimonas caeni]|uniref:DUF1521 domain-containing protein n=1 Tax=Parachitinimonas caeni TaxID=3031301 RepID=A0ABT7DWF5_9NEIS|nr:hypothetical protein [Parachitinimonas caeni]MDK2124380.1 hypothetical protein [Parachitinimonas caeni]
MSDRIAGNTSPRNNSIESSGIEKFDNTQKNTTGISAMSDPDAGHHASPKTSAKSNISTIQASSQQAPKPESIAPIKPSTLQSWGATAGYTLSLFYKKTEEREGTFDGSIRTNHNLANQSWSTGLNQSSSETTRNVYQSLDNIFSTRNIVRGTGDGGNPIAVADIGHFHTAMYSGAHLIVEDGGQLAQDLLAQNGAEERISSHHPGGGPQYGIDLQPKGSGHVLFGTTNQNDTFIQFEGSGPKEPGHAGDFIEHTSNYYSYLQVGAQGLTIPASEKDGRQLVAFGSKDNSHSLNSGVQLEIANDDRPLTNMHGEIVDDQNNAIISASELEDNRPSEKVSENAKDDNKTTEIGRSQTVDKADNQQKPDTKHLPDDFK